MIDKELQCWQHWRNIECYLVFSTKVWYKPTWYGFNLYEDVFRKTKEVTI